MKNRTVYILTLSISLSLWVFNLAFADKIAYTEDGEKVLLKDDGTWEYVKEESKDKDQSDFRKVKWGMSKDRVRKTEESKLIDEGDDRLLIYQGIVANMNCFITYRFVNDVLVGAQYHFEEEHTNKNDYLSDYFNLQDTLKKKYGEPKDTKIDWRDTLYVDDKEKYGFAVSLGHLKLSTDWETPATTIALKLSGENYEIQLSVVYFSKAHFKLIKKESEERDADEF